MSFSFPEDKEFEEYIIELYQIVQQNPNDQSYYELGEALAKIQKWSEAIASYQNALKLNPNLPGIHQKIGDALQQQAKAEKTNLLNYYKQKI
ncbi:MULTISPECIES: tetratricopeptide repeat protein, partial [unclassified Okeania]